MTPCIGEKYLITTDNWFIAPNGRQYRSVFGTVNAISGDKETLGISTNRGSTNWYVSIGSMIVAGCQIHYCIKTDACNAGSFELQWHDGKESGTRKMDSQIYFAD